MSLPFNQRLHETNQYVLKRFLPARQLPHLKNERFKFIDVFMKEMFNIWDAHYLLSHLIDAKRLEHENDGLIFTIDECPYYPGTC